MSYLSILLIPRYSGLSHSAADHISTGTMVLTFKVKIQFVSLCGFVKYMKAYPLTKGLCKCRNKEVLRLSGRGQGRGVRITSVRCGRFLISARKALDAFQNSPTTQTSESQILLCSRAISKILTGFETSCKCSPYCLLGYLLLKNREKR